MADVKTFLSTFPKIGDGISWIIEQITDFISSAIGIDIVPFQSKIIAVLILLFIIYLFIAVINFGTALLKKILKWGLVVLFILFVLSVLASIFI